MPTRSDDQPVDQSRQRAESDIYLDYDPQIAVENVTDDYASSVSAKAPIQVLDPLSMGGPFHRDKLGILLSAPAIGHVTGFPVEAPGRSSSDALTAHENISYHLIKHSFTVDSVPPQEAPPRFQR